MPVSVRLGLEIRGPSGLVPQRYKRSPCSGVHEAGGPMMCVSLLAERRVPTFI
jgi:hypothetical protein